MVCVCCIALELYWIKSRLMNVLELYCIKSRLMIVLELYCIKCRLLIVLKLYCIKSRLMIVLELCCNKSRPMIILELYCIKSRLSFHIIINVYSSIIGSLTVYHATNGPNRYFSRRFHSYSPLSRRHDLYTHRF